MLISPDIYLKQCVSGYVLHNSLLHLHTHTHPFNGPFSGTTRVGWNQNGKINLDFTEARDSEWQWHQLGHMQVCTSLQTDNHASTSPLSFYRPDALPAAQPTASKHWRHILLKNCDFLNTDTSQSTVVTCIGCGGVFTYDFVTNFLLSLSVK